MKNAKKLARFIQFDQLIDGKWQFVGHSKLLTCGYPVRISAIPKEEIIKYYRNMRSKEKKEIKLYIKKQPALL